MSNVTSFVHTKNGKQYMNINGKDMDGLAYITYLPENGRFGDFAAAGYKLYSVCVFFGTNILNESSSLPFFSAGVFDNEKPDFSNFDRDIRRILDVCPDAYIFPRVNISLSRKWEDEHPEELCDSGVPKNPHRKRVSFSSDIWAEEVKRCLTLFVKHIEESDYAENIVGYQIAGGNTEEWFAPDLSGNKSRRSREKFAEYIKEKGLEGNETDYYRFASEMTALRICEFAAHVKELTQRRLAVGTFYGYTLEVCARTHTHHDVMRLLKSDDIDFLCSPVSYSHNRCAGVDHAISVPLHSFKLYNKLYFSENDTRTHLSRAVNDMPHYNTPIWFGYEKPVTTEILKMHFARTFVRGHACWWFDMWGGWYNDPDYMEFMEKVRNIAEMTKGENFESAAEVAVFVDEKCLAGISPENPTYRSVISGFRKQLGYMGAPYDVYLSEDFDAVKDNYKAYISLVPLETALSKNIEESSEKPLLVINTENCDTTPEELREFLRQSGVHIYCEQNGIIMANKSYLFLHTSRDGEHILDAESDFVDLFTGEKLDKSLVCEKGKSYLFKLRSVEK